MVISMPSINTTCATFELHSVTNLPSAQAEPSGAFGADTAPAYRLKTVSASAARRTRIVKARLSRLRWRQLTT